MHKTLRRDLDTLLANISAMRESFGEANKARGTSDEFPAHLAFCETLGAVEGQATVVKIDLEVFEASPDIPADVAEFQKSPQMQAEVEVSGVIADCNAAVDAVEQKDYVSPVEQALGKGALQRHLDSRGSRLRESVRPVTNAT